MTITVRAERFPEAVAVSDIVKRAYADVAHSDGRQHLMVERLRATGAYVPQLSLIAEADGTAIGHILLTRVFIGKAGVASLALAPLSVVPGHRGRGAGKRLVGVAHARARQLGFGSIVLVGMAGYDARFGYEPLQSRAAVRSSGGEQHDPATDAGRSVGRERDGAVSAFIDGSSTLEGAGRLAHAGCAAPTCRRSARSPAAPRPRRAAAGGRCAGPGPRSSPSTGRSSRPCGPARTAR